MLHTHSSVLSHPLLCCSLHYIFFFFIFVVVQLIFHTIPKMILSLSDLTMDRFAKWFCIAFCSTSINTPTMRYAHKYTFSTPSNFTVEKKRHITYTDITPIYFNFRTLCTLHQIVSTMQGVLSAVHTYTHSKTTTANRAKMKWTTKIVHIQTIQNCNEDFSLKIIHSMDSIPMVIA